MVILLALVACSPKEPTGEDKSTQITSSYVTDNGTVRVGKGGAKMVNDDSVAPVTIDFFFDPSCEACSTYMDITNKDIGEYIEKGVVDVIYHPISYLNDKTPDDYSNRAGAYFLAVAEFAPDKVFDFVNTILSESFRPEKPGADITEDSKFVKVLEDLELTEEQIDKIETNKENFVSPIIAATNDFFSEKSGWLKLSKATNDDGDTYLFTPFILVNKTGELSNSALELKSKDKLVEELKNAIDLATKSPILVGEVEPEVYNDKEE